MLSSVHRQPYVMWGDKCKYQEWQNTRMNEDTEIQLSGHYRRNSETSEVEWTICSPRLCCGCDKNLDYLILSQINLGNFLDANTLS